MNQTKTRTIVGIGVLTALVIVLQTFAQVLPKLIPGIPFSITLALTPIVVGAALYGWKAGGWLGFVFGCVTLFDAAVFLTINAPATVIICLLKGTLCGLAAGGLYQLLKKNRLIAVIAAAIASPVVNTGVFLLGCFAFFYGTISEWAEGAGFPSAGAYMVFGLAGVNFLVELGVNLVLASAVVRIIDIVAGGKKQTA